MYGFPRPLVPNDVKWNRHRGHHNPQWRPFHQPRAPFRPRNQGFNNHQPMHGSSEEHWCETCDRGFPNEDLLSKHKQQHQKCNIDGCQFIAHPKVITKHIQMQHSSGLYKKIANLNNPEDIEKWREERKKKYPTKVNIDKKAEELKEKIERGEKMNLGRKDWRSKKDENGHNRDFNNSGHGMKRTYNNNNNQQPTKFRKPRKPIPKILPTPEDSRSLAPFAGIQSLEMDSDEEVEENLTSDGLIEDDEIETVKNDSGTIESKRLEVAEKPVVCSALSSLMCEYGSSDEEIDDEALKHIKEQKTSEVDRNSKTKVVTKENISKPSNKAFKDQSKNINTSWNTVEVNKNSPNVTTKHNNGKDSHTNPIHVKAVLDKNNIKSNTCGKVEVPMIENAKNCDISNKTPEPNLGGNNELNASKKNYESVEDDDSGPDEVKVEKENESVNFSKGNETEKMIKQKKVEVVRKKTIYRKPKPKLPSTLIYKLLSKEMRQERNQVLQCIRYIRKNNYFDKYFDNYIVT